MKYVKYKFNYKNGITERYVIEIEPHEEDSVLKVLNDINDILDENMLTNSPGVVELRTTEGRIHIRISEVQSFLVSGIE